MHDIKCIIFDLDRCSFNTPVYSTGDVPGFDYTYGDMHHVASLTQEKILVTAGDTEVQQQKIARVGIAHHFAEVHIDTIGDKESIFKSIMSRRMLQPHRIMVVGDNPNAELGAGKHLGMVTVQTLRPTVVRWAEADFHVTSFAELDSIISAFDAMSRRRGCTPL
ncbi:HAD hydrolase-like protein [Candidatus Kaiserbacteria bacterium]|nr:HAD hydrolase-like protein [Candidatus Kaiserbacteria bacterium]